MIGVFSDWCAVGGDSFDWLAGNSFMKQGSSFQSVCNFNWSHLLSRLVSVSPASWMTNHHLVVLPVVSFTNFLFTLFGVIPQSFVIALLTALEVQLQCVPHTRRAPLTLTFAARFTSARGGLPVLALVELGCFELDVEVGLRSRLRTLGFLLTTAVHSAPASPALVGSGACETVASFLFAESSAVFNSPISALRTAISLLSSVTTVLLRDKEQGMQINVEEIAANRLRGTPAQ